MIERHKAPAELRRLTTGVVNDFYLILATTLCAVCGVTAQTQVIKAPEYQIKAAYLYNFIEFIDWPDGSFPSADAPVFIGVLGDDPFNGFLDREIDDKKIKGRKVQIKRAREIDGLAGCHMMFVCSSETRRLPAILDALKGRHVLTIADMDRFAERGGMIDFFMEGNKVRFKINLDAAERAGLKISSQLLRLGNIIREKPLTAK